MNKFIVKLGILGLLTGAIAISPLTLHAQTNSTTSTVEKKLSKRVFPFHGKLAAIDKSAKTITIGKETLQITSETKITKSGKPAVLEDAALGDDTGGTYRKNAEGKLDAVSLRIGPKPLLLPNSKTNAP